ncbi:hypothetical protein V8C42DRAFT_309966 [Trichoderma barbatum]
MTRAGRLFRDRAGPCAQALLAKHGYMLLPVPSLSSCWPAPRTVGWAWLVEQGCVEFLGYRYMYTCDMGERKRLHPIIRLLCTWACGHDDDRAAWVGSRRLGW